MTSRGLAAVAGKLTVHTARLLKDLEGMFSFSTAILGGAGFEAVASWPLPLGFDGAAGTLPAWLLRVAAGLLLLFFGFDVVCMDRVLVDSLVG